MKLDEAKTHRAALSAYIAALDAGIAAAKATGSDEVDLTSSLQALDDKARDELQRAIAESGGG